MEGRSREEMKEGGREEACRCCRSPPVPQAETLRPEVHSALFLPVAGSFHPSHSPHLCREAPPHRSVWVTSMLSWVPMERLRSRKQGHRFTVVRMHRSGEKFSHMGNAATPRTAPTALPPRSLHQAPEGPPLSPEPHCAESPPSISAGLPIPAPLAITLRNWTRNSAPQ